MDLFKHLNNCPSDISLYFSPAYKFTERTNCISEGLIYILIGGRLWCIFWLFPWINLVHHVIYILHLGHPPKMMRAHRGHTYWNQFNMSGLLFWYCEVTQTSLHLNDLLTWSIRFIINSQGPRSLDLHRQKPLCWFKIPIIFAVCTEWSIGMQKTMKKKNLTKIRTGYQWSL